MASVKLQDIPTVTSIAEGDKIPFTSAPGGTPVSKNITIENLLNYYDSRRYDTLELADAAAYAAGKLLVIAKNHTLTANTVLTASIMIIPGGSFTKASTYTITINGSFSNPSNSQCFIGFTTGVTFGPKSIEQAHPEWWTSNTTPGTTNMTDAIHSALNAVVAGGKVKLLPTDYKVTALVHPFKQTIFEGTATNNEGTHITGTGNVVLTYGSAVDTTSRFSTLKNMEIEAAAGNLPLWIDNLGVHMDNLYLHGGSWGLYITNSVAAIISNIHSHGLTYGIYINPTGAQAVNLNTFINVGGYSPDAVNGVGMRIKGQVSTRLNTFINFDSEVVGTGLWNDGLESLFINPWFEFCGTYWIREEVTGSAVYLGYNVRAADGATNVFSPYSILYGQDGTLTGPFKIETLKTLTNFFLPLPVATGSLPAGSDAMNGRVIIEDAGVGDINLIIYGRGERYRINGGAPF